MIENDKTEHVDVKIEALMPRVSQVQLKNEPPHDKTNKMTAPSEDSDQPGHSPSLIRAFAVCSMGS